MQANGSRGPRGSPVLLRWRSAKGLAALTGCSPRLALGVALAQSALLVAAPLRTGLPDGETCASTVASVSATRPQSRLLTRVVTFGRLRAYRLSGELRGGVVVDSAEPGTVTLILDGVSVYAARPAWWLSARTTSCCGRPVELQQPVRRRERLDGSRAAIARRRL